MGSEIFNATDSFGEQQRNRIVHAHNKCMVIFEFRFHSHRPSKSSLKQRCGTVFSWQIFIFRIRIGILLGHWTAFDISHRLLSFALKWCYQRNRKWVEKKPNNQSSSKWNWLFRRLYGLNYFNPIFYSIDVCVYGVYGVSVCMCALSCVVRMNRKL